MGDRNTRGSTIRVSVVDFGMGSLGKLNHIARSLPGVMLSLDESMPDVLRDRIAGDLREHVAFETRDDPPAVSLVINDPVAADREWAAGQRVVYVDSLPYLWRLADEVPENVSTYCAQRFPGRLAPESPLYGRAVEWVDAIVPEVHRRHEGGRGLVVSVGGLRSPLMADEAQDAYIEHALLPAVESLTELGLRTSHVCGGVPERWRRTVAAAAHGAAVENLSADEFHRLLVGADLLVTSPGSTTMLEASAVGVPVSLLPPQNVSQVINADLFGHSPALGRYLRWPVEVLDDASFARWRTEGELHALEKLNSRISEFGSSLRRDVPKWAEDLHRLMTDDRTELVMPRPACGGARQVAEHLRKYFSNSRQTANS